MEKKIDLEQLGILEIGKEDKPKDPAESKRRIDKKRYAMERTRKGQIDVLAKRREFSGDPRGFLHPWMKKIIKPRVLAPYPDTGELIMGRKTINHDQPTAKD